MLNSALSCKSSHRQNVNQHGCIPIKLYSQKQMVDCAWPTGNSLLTLGVEDDSWSLWHSWFPSALSWFRFCQGSCNLPPTNDFCWSNDTSCFSLYLFYTHHQQSSQESGKFLLKYGGSRSPKSLLCSLFCHLGFERAALILDPRPCLLCQLPLFQSWEAEILQSPNLTLQHH